MVYCDRPVTKRLIDTIPTDSKITVKEMYTELEIVTTPYELLVASEALNKLFNEKGHAKVLDVLLCLGIEPELLNTVPHAGGLLYGWNWGCYLGYTQPWIDFWLNLDDKDGRIIFNLSYDIDPCDQCDNCTGEECNYSHESLLP